MRPKSGAESVPNFGIVYSGRKVSDEELDRLIALTKRIKDELGLGVCMGLGILSEENMQRLANAGVVGSITISKRPNAIFRISFRPQICRPCQND